MKRNFNNSANSDWDLNLCSERVWLSMFTKSLILERFYNFLLFHIGNMFMFRED